VASVFSHAAAALGIGACFYRPGIPKRTWAIGALCSVLPDLDVIGFRSECAMAIFGGTEDLHTHSFSLLS
jgi:hypothetical protein